MISRSVSATGAAGSPASGGGGSGGGETGGAHPGPGGDHPGPGGAHAGPLHDEAERTEQEQRGDEDDDLVAVHDQAAHVPGAGRNQLRELVRCRAEDGFMLAGVFDEERNADGGNEHCELGPFAQRPVGKKLDQHAETRANHHGQHEHDRSAEVGLRWEEPVNERREVVTRERAKHEDVTVGEVDEPQDAVNHRVAQRDKRVNRTERQAIDQLLEKF